MTAQPDAAATVAGWHAASSEPAAFESVRLLRLSPGDALAITLPFDRLSVEEAAHVRDVVRHQLDRPDLPVLVFPAGTDVAVLSPDQEPT